MKLSKQHKQILLVLLGNNPNALRVSEIVRLVIKFKMEKWSLSTGEDKFPRPRVISASLCRSLKTLLARGLATQQPDYYGSLRWRLTIEGLATAREVKLELEIQIEKLRHQIEELNELKSFLLYKS